MRHHYAKQAHWCSIDGLRPHIVDGAPLLVNVMYFITYLDKPSKLATTFSFAILVDVFANLESARQDLSFDTLFVHQGLLVTALQGGPPLLGDPDLSSND